MMEDIVPMEDFDVAFPINRIETNAPDAKLSNYQPNRPLQHAGAPPTYLDLRPTTISAEDRADPAEASTVFGTCGSKCCYDDSFGSRLWNRLKLDHLIETSVKENSPGFILLKSILVIILALLIDKGTRNPDSVTSVFIALLGMASYYHVSVSLAKQIILTGLLGAVVGTLIGAATYLPPTTDPNKWMLLLSVPWSVVTTLYIMLFAGIENPGAKATGVFSSLFVMLVPFAYPPVDSLVPASDPRRLIWQTLLVRVIALATGVFSAFVVNVVVSAAAPLNIFRTAQYFTERYMWRSLKFRLEPIDPRNQKNFDQVVSQLELAPFVDKAAEAWVFSNATREQIRLIRKRAMAMFRYLTFRSFLELYEEIGPEESGQALIDFSIRNSKGSSLQQLSLAEELEELERLAAPAALKIVLRSILVDLDKYQLEWHDKGWSTFWGNV